MSYQLVTKRARPKSGSWLVDYLVHRVKAYNKNFVGIFVGDPGSGKSYSALRLAEVISKQFNRKFSVDNVVFKAADFIDLLSDAKRLKKGEVVIFDEAGTGEAMSSRNWYSIQNKLVDSAVQTFRFKNLYVFFTTPLDSFVDSHARKLFNARFVTQRIDKRRKVVVTKPYFFVRTNFGQDVQPVFLKIIIKVKGEDVVVKKVDPAEFSLPSPDLIQEYELKKQEALHKMYKSMGKTIKRLEVVQENPNIVEELKAKGLKPQEISGFLLNLKLKKELEDKKLKKLKKRRVMRFESLGWGD
ncbi:MAG: hypothetical protein GWP10_22205 [Nitrospiraceae bacterium]|nr:hypothetical protein [Nitrospiraceae bacterium]